MGWVLKHFRKLEIPDRAINMFQDNVGEMFEIISKKQVLDGNVIGVDLDIGVNVISHKLGRKYIGWMPIRTIKACVVSFANEQGETDKNIYVNSSAKTKAWIWVF